MATASSTPPWLVSQQSYAGKLDLPHTATYIEDFGKALVILGERDEALGQAWHVPNDQPQISQGEFARLVFEEVGLPPKVSAMGKTMLRLGGIFIPGAREVVEMMYEFEKPFIVDSSKFEKRVRDQGHTHRARPSRPRWIGIAHIAK